MQLEALVLLVLTLPICGLLHALACRLWKGPLPTRQQIAARSAGLVALLMTMGVSVWSWPESHSWSLVLMVAVVAFGSGHVYFHIFNMSETARRIRILVAIASGKSFANGADRFQQQQMITRRIRRLTDSGQVTFTAGRYQAKRTFLLWVAMGFRIYEKLLFPRRCDKTSGMDRKVNIPITHYPPSTRRP